MGCLQRVSEQGAPPRNQEWHGEAQGLCDRARLSHGIHERRVQEAAVQEEARQKQTSCEKEKKSCVQEEIN